MSLPTHFSLRAANGKTIQIPVVGYGTWASGENTWAKDAVLTALKEGYRHLDCAWMYGVDESIGEAIRESGVPREEIFITSKFWPHFGAPENVSLCLDKILKNMGLDYVDLYLAHWPCVWKPLSSAAIKNAFAGHGTSADDKGYATGDDGKPIIDWEHSTAHLAELAGQKGSFVPTWKAMQDCVRSGKARAVGVSNFTIADLKEVLAHEGDVPVSCNQIEVHPWLPQTALVNFGNEHGILTTCYSPFAGQKKDGATLLKDEKVLELAKKNGMDVGQLLGSWAVQRGTVPLGKSATPERIRSNLAVKKLSEEDMKALDGMEVANGEGRTVTQDWGVPLFQE